MTNETDTWYVLEDGTHAHPADVSTDKDGVMKHKNGVAVKLRANGIPLTSGVPSKEKTRDLKADKPKGYKTRDLKAE